MVVSNDSVKAHKTKNFRFAGEACWYIITSKPCAKKERVRKASLTVDVPVSEEGIVLKFGLLGQMFRLCREISLQSGLFVTRDNFYSILNGFQICANLLDKGLQYRSIFSITDVFPNHCFI